MFLYRILILQIPYYKLPFSEFPVCDEDTLCVIVVEWMQKFRQRNIGKYFAIDALIYYQLIIWTVDSLPN
jgi:hypothetical protein